MARLFDYLSVNDNTFKHFKDNKGVFPVIIADNAVKYFYETSTRDLWELHNEKHFPVLTPPFETMFVETKCPNYASTEKGIVELKDYPEHWGCLIQRSEVKDLNYEKRAAKINSKMNHIFDEVLSKNPKWTIIVNYFFQEKGCNYNSGLFTMFYLDSAGIALKEPYIYGYAPDPSVVLTKEYCSGIMGSFLAPIMFAVSMMHCKNVNLDPVIPPRAVSKKFKKKHGIPRSRYYVLNIEPMKEVFKIQGGIEKNGLNKAIHICRGHFKDYRNSNGLFGKFKDIYWWESHARGNAEIGSVNKDYKIGTKYLNGVNQP